jgi:hypothetical protein
MIARLREVRRRWRENEIATNDFNAQEAEIFQQFKREHPETWETEWPEIQRKARE